jgi:hypothetical protein
MKFRDPTTWGQTFLPKPKYSRMTWKRWLLLAFAVAFFVDQFFVPFYGKADPGGAGDGMIFLIVAFRAVSRSDLPLSAVLAGGFSAALALTMNHGLLASPGWLWTPLGIFLVLFILFWGRGKRDQADTSGGSTSPDPGSVLHAGNSHD